MKVLQINPVVRATTSTGRIMQQIGKKIVAHGWESYLAFSGGRDDTVVGNDSLSPETMIERDRSKRIGIGNRIDLITHILSTRLLDRHGLSSSSATRSFISALSSLSPDLVHLHNLHGYYINYPLLFSYLRESEIPVVWTLHDCWAYTGHCYYYSAVGCGRWKKGCHDCPQRSSFPRSWFFDRSARNHKEKAETFNSLLPGQLTLVCVSEWMREELGHSFLRDRECGVINNGVDIGIFYPRNHREREETKRRYSIPNDKKIFLAVAAGWTPHKGGDDLLRIASILAHDELLLIVGKIKSGLLAERRRRNNLPGNMRVLDQISDLATLSRIYASSDVFINPTYQDNFPTVNLEAQACGVPVVTYGSGGSGESIVDGSGLVIKTGDYRGLLEAARYLYRMDKASIQEICRRNIVANYQADSQFDKYIDLYQSKLFGR